MVGLEYFILCVFVVGLDRWSLPLCTRRSGQTSAMSASSVMCLRASWRPFPPGMDGCSRDRQAVCVFLERKGETFFEGRVVSLPRRPHM